MRMLKLNVEDKRFFIVSVLGFCISGLIFCLVLAGGARLS